MDGPMPDPSTLDAEGDDDMVCLSKILNIVLVLHTDCLANSL